MTDGSKQAYGHAFVLLAASSAKLVGHPLADQMLADVTQALQTHAGALFGQSIPAVGTPLYTDARLYAEAGIPGVIYGAGPRTVLESNAKRADEHLVLNDLRLATKVIARTLADLLR